MIFPYSCLVEQLGASLRASDDAQVADPKHQSNAAEHPLHPRTTTIPIHDRMSYRNSQDLSDMGNDNTPDGAVTSSEEDIVPTASPNAHAVVTSPNTAALLSAADAPPRRVSTFGPRIHPEWPHAMVSTRFFGTCGLHAAERKNERNFFCLGCAPGGGEGTNMCQFCVPSHSERCDGLCIQMYRYMYQDVVRVAAVSNLIDLSGIQQYRANSHLAVHLRPMGPPTNKSPYLSECQGGCGRCLDPQWAYCSLGCKMGIGNGDAPEVGASHNGGGGGHGGSRNGNGNGNTPRGNGNGGKNGGGGGGAKAARQAAAPKAPAMASQSGEGILTRRQWSDDELELSGVMLTRSGNKRPAFNAYLKGAKRRKALRPMRSPSL